MRISLSLFASGWMLFCLGCGDPNQAKIIPMDGKITLAGGKPVPKGTRLYFQPTNGRMGTASGVTDGSGAFQLIHQSGVSGLALGNYTIQIAAPEGADITSFFKTIPRKYFDGGGCLTAKVDELTHKIELTIQ